MHGYINFTIGKCTVLVFYLSTPVISVGVLILLKLKSTFKCTWPYVWGHATNLAWATQQCSMASTMVLHGATPKIPGMCEVINGLYCTTILNTNITQRNLSYPDSQLTKLQKCSIRAVTVLLGYLNNTDILKMFFKVNLYTVPEI